MKKKLSIKFLEKVIVKAFFELFKYKYFRKHKTLRNISFFEIVKEYFLDNFCAYLVKKLFKNTL